MCVISFIIPFFNGGKYISECLDTLYNQNISESDFEVIVVDDCSTDGQALETLRAVMEKHSNIRLLRNEMNLRVGSSRNHGFSEARGEYIWFIDQDDKIQYGCLKGLLETMRKNDLDLITFDYLDFDDTGRAQPHRLVTHDTDVMKGLDYAYTICNTQIWENQWDTNVWHQIYKRAFLLENNISFTEVSYYDDMIVNLKSLIYAKRMQSVSQPYYHYRFNVQSVINTEVGVGGRTLFDGTVNASVVLLDFAKEIEEVDAHFSGLFMEAVPYRANSFARSLLRISHEQQGKFYEQAELHPDVVDKVKPYLSRFNKALIEHPWIAHAMRPLGRCYRKLAVVLS